MKNYPFLSCVSMVTLELKTFVIEGKAKNKLKINKKDVEDLPLSFNSFLIQKWEDSQDKSYLSKYF